MKSNTPFALFRILVAVGLGCFAHMVAAGALDALPEGRVLTVPTAWAESGAASLRRDGFGERAGAPVWRVEVSDEARQPWLAQLRASLAGAVDKADTGVLIAELRTLRTRHESDQARVRLVVSDKAKPFPRIASAEFSIGRDWTEIVLPFEFSRAHASGEVAVTMDLGFGEQTIELAGLRAVYFGQAVAFAKLPRTRSTYVGHEPEARWRAEALARIEKIRKGDFVVEVTDAQGRPVADATVRARLTAHRFDFGTVVNVETLSSGTPDVEPYRRLVTELFNSASLENGLKWTNWASDGKPADYRERTLRTLDWIKEAGLRNRGHVMVWPSWRFLPAHIKALRGTPDEKRIPELTLAHIRDIAEATREYVTEWDVLNEPVSNHDLMDLFGKRIMVDWFKAAEAVLPGVPLYLNDWGNHDQIASADHLRAFEEVAFYLREQGAPLGGLGLQGHIGSTLSAPADILSTLDRYQKNFGLPVRITEFDVTTDDEEIQGDYTRDFLIAMYSHPSVVGVQFWGFWEGRHWQPKAALYRMDWTEKPNGAAYRKLVKEIWHTDETGRTDAQGRWMARGFHGRYVVTLTRGDRVHEVQLDHAPGENGVWALVWPE